MAATPVGEPVDGVYVTPRGQRLAADSVSWVATRSGGPGGQHANTSDTAVTISIEIAATGLPQVVCDRIVAALGPVVTATSARSRSQWRNRQLAWQEVLDRLDAAAAALPAGVPLTLTPGRFLFTYLGLLVASVLGSAVSLRRVTRVDPAAAIGGGS